MSDFVWQDGEIVDLIRVRAPSSRTSAGFWLGDGLFETMLADGGAIFALERHLARLSKGAEELNVTIVQHEIDRGLMAAMNWLGDDCGQVRITVLSSGEHIVTARAHRIDTKPLQLIVYPFPKNELSVVSGVKTLSYAESGAALRFAADHHCDDVVFINRNGWVMESAVANLLVWDGAGWWTPTQRSGCLAGVTRELLIEEFDVKERDFQVEEFADFLAVALTSSLRDIQSVSTLQGDSLGRLSFEPEPVDRLRERFQDWRKKNPRP